MRKTGQRMEGVERGVENMEGADKKKSMAFCVEIWLFCEIL